MARTPCACRLGDRRIGHRTALALVSVDAATVWNQFLLGSLSGTFETCRRSALLRHATFPDDVRLQGKTGSSWPTTKLTRLTLNGHEDRISPVTPVIPAFCLDVQ